MKIHDVNLAMRNMPPAHTIDRAEAGGGIRSFKRELSELNEEAYAEYIGDLIESIDKQGELLGKRADIKELQKYREMISQLINETVSNSFVFTKNSAFDSRGRHRVYTMIKKVNAHLDNIAQAVLTKQAGNLSILNDVDDIRGLLVDLYL